MTTAALATAALAVLAGASVAAAPVPTPIGSGPLYRPGPLSAAVAAARPVGALRCTDRSEHRVGLHLELFAHGRVVIVPAGIGIAPPRRRGGASVTGGRCSYALRTSEPTGVVELSQSARVTLGQLFQLWGQPLSSRRLAGFRAIRGERVQVFVAGRRWPGDPRAIPLTRHAQIVLELGGYVPPHSLYLFSKGL